MSSHVASASSHHQHPTELTVTLPSEVSPHFWAPSLPSIPSLSNFPKENFQTLTWREGKSLVKEIKNEKKCCSQKEKLQYDGDVASNGKLLLKFDAY